MEISHCYIPTNIMVKKKKQYFKGMNDAVVKQEFITDMTCMLEFNYWCNNKLCTQLTAQSWWQWLFALHLAIQ
jgi:hypothetical protein